VGKASREFSFPWLQEASAARRSQVPGEARAGDHQPIPKASSPTAVPLLGRTRPHAASQRGGNQKRRGKGRVQEKLLPTSGEEESPIQAGRMPVQSWSLSNPQQFGAPRHTGKDQRCLAAHREPTGECQAGRAWARGQGTPPCPPTAGAGTQQGPELLGARELVLGRRWRVTSLCQAVPSRGDHVLLRKGCCSAPAPVGPVFMRGWMRPSQQGHGAVRITPCSHGHRRARTGRAARHRLHPLPNKLNSSFRLSAWGLCLASKLTETGETARPLRSARRTGMKEIRPDKPCRQTTPRCLPQSRGGPWRCCCPQQKGCAAGELPTARAGPLGPVSVQLGPSAEPEEPGQTPWKRLFPRLVSRGKHPAAHAFVSASGTLGEPLPGQGQTPPAFTHCLREVLGQL